jgi:hypothetical protein
MKYSVISGWHAVNHIHPGGLAWPGFRKTIITAGTVRNNTIKERISNYG